MERIGVRELSSHASRYLARVCAGETICVTDRGRPVALLAPIRADGWEDFINTGLVLPASEGDTELDEMPEEYHIDASGELEAMRADER